MSVAIDFFANRTHSAQFLLRKLRAMVERSAR